MSCKLVARTLRKVVGPCAPIWVSADALGLSHVIGHVDKPPPPIGVVGRDPGDRVEGRFFPTVKYPNSGPLFSGVRNQRGPAILIRNHGDSLVVLAEAVHELGHWASYCEECGHVPQTNRAAVRCRYEGEHDAEFYARLEPMYRAAGVPTYAARMVEGSYDYPETWRGDEWQ